MRASETEQTGNIGETAVALAFKRLGWHVAPNPAGEVGTDLLLQARDGRRFDLAAIIGAQVKSGPSFFGEPQRDESGVVTGWWYRDPNGEHFKYWLSHTVPHILVLHDEAANQSYWVHITTNEVTTTGKGAKILVPKSSVIDAEHADELVQVAAHYREGPRWEGSAWEGGTSVLPADRLRYALLTPRLMAPHPNQTVAKLRPDQAIALLVKMRLRDLQPRPFGTQNAAPDLEECRSSHEWQWRLYAALYDVLINHEDHSVLDSLVDSATNTHSRTASAVISCALRIENFDPRSGLAIVEKVLTRDDCQPVDHAWLTLHKARCLSELGDWDQSRQLALDVQNLRTSAPDDPTAMAITGAGADLIFSAQIWGGDLAHAISSQDTVASWWRSQEVAWGLQYHFDDHFTAWATGTAPTDPYTKTWMKLRTASLVAGLSADHSSWRHTSGLMARHVLTFSTEQPDSIVDALTTLRQVGDTESVERATRHILRSGPANAVRDAAIRVRLDNATRTSIRTDLQLIEEAADVLDVESADRNAQWILTNLNDQTSFVERFRPMFKVTYFLLRTLRKLVPVVSPTKLRAIIATILALPPQSAQTYAHDWGALVRSVPLDVWTDGDRAQLTARRPTDNDEFGQELDTVIADRDPTHRDTLRSHIREGNSAALASFGDIRDLDTETVQTLVEKLSARIAEQIAELRQRQSTDAGGPASSDLILVNVRHPSCARWEPIIELLTFSSPYTDHLPRPLKLLHQCSKDIPPDVIDALIEPIHALTLTGRRNLPFFGFEDVRGVAANALAALRPEAFSDNELWELMDADTADLRAAAVQVIAVRGNDNAFDTLRAMARDTDPWVRAVIANQIADMASAGDEHDRYFTLLRHLLSDEGILVAQMVAASLHGLPKTKNTDALVTELRDHISAQVRQWVIEYQTATNT
ncbi:DUF4365 domain-containing protein [Rhodococcus qingshengii]|uniref:DUF4365 domain-containing protein n=1 Tax=Rhodococcus qingshengii TaxID=334542 RepID=UPI001BEBE257|nr:DUF4365 domain-containing protein [Rhodococcus qingshengii]MBT2270254.1 DUF4365 domain-containing protein [Rhodococcus qingshengii]